MIAIVLLLIGSVHYWNKSTFWYPFIYLILSYKLNTIAGHEQNEFELTAFIIVLIMLSKLHTEGILRFFVRLLFKRSKNHNIK